MEPVSDHTGSRPGFRALVWFRRSVTGFSPTRLGFRPTLVHVGFVVFQVALNGVYFEYFDFLLLVSFHPHPILYSFIPDTRAA